jgi:hypothetical protein
LEQPAGMLERMRKAKFYYDAVMSWRQATMFGEWKNQHKDYWAAIQSLDSLHGGKEWRTKTTTSESA